MNVLVAYASRHGSTEGIAERIGATLGREGVEATLQPVESRTATQLRGTTPL